VGFRANVWNIGAEGMFVMGAIGAGILAINLSDTHSVWLLPAMVLAAAISGMIWASLAAFLRVWANANEILVTLMMNYIAQLFLAYLVNGPMRDPDGFNYPQSPLYGPDALFSPLFEGMRLNTSISITIAAVVIIWLLLERSFIGFQMRVGGAAPIAARYAGFSASRAVWIGLLTSGACAGMAGMMEVSGPLGQLTPVISPGYGYVAIIVAFIGRLNALGVVLGGLLLSLLYMGGENVQLAMNIPSAMTRTFQGMLLFFLLAADVLIAFRLKIDRRV
jgi:simple sugar transport system permease protein